MYWAIVSLVDIVLDLINFHVHFIKYLIIDKIELTIIVLIKLTIYY